MSDDPRRPGDADDNEPGFASPSHFEPVAEPADEKTEAHDLGSERHGDETRQNTFNALGAGPIGGPDWMNPNETQASPRADGGEWEQAEAKKPRNLGWLRSVALVVVAALVGGVTATVIDNNDNGTVTSATAVHSDAASTAAAASSAAATPNNIRSVLDKVQPAVVTINVTESGGTGSGTGMIVSSDGEILTNNHVVTGATKIEVTLNNETSPRTATLLGTDSTIDSALIKIDATNLPTVEFGDSSAAQVGDEVVAIGNALALQGGPSVTSGIISAKDRSIADSSASLNNLIQTDTAINPGNSGGPLVNMAGQVIGMNTAVIRGDTGEYQNIGFALSINTVRPAIADLRTGVTRQPAYLGLSPVTLTDSIKSRYNLTPSKGVVVSEVQTGAPADGAGITRFDVITKIDSTDITTSDQLIDYIRGKKPNDKVQITYFRGDKQTTVTATLTARPATSE